jgi:hypothetical protein
VTSLAFATSLLLLQESRAVVSPPPQLVAIVSALKGSAWLQSTTGVRQPLALYDWVASSTIVNVAENGHVELIMMDGHRYSLNGGVRAKLSPAAPTAIRGSVTQEPALPQIVSLAPIAGRTPRTVGAVRVRGRPIAKLNPCASAVTLRERTVLMFDPVQDASQYEVEVRTIADGPVLTQTIERPPLAIPAGVLTAGAQYVWTVKTVGADPPARAEARFTTLDASAESARAALASALDPAGAGLLGGVDLHLGLLNEAVLELTAAAARFPQDDAVERAAKRAQATLANACQ